MVMNKKHGQGIEYQPNSGIYDGSFEKDQRHGTGLMIDTSGDRYDGEWL